MPKLNLEKGKEALKLVLQKKGITTVPSADLAFVLDVSGSFRGEHNDGTTQTLLERLVPWGMLFDPDQKLDVFTFSDGEENAYHVGDITPDTCDGYIENNIINAVPGYGGCTDYSYVLEAVLKNFGWIAEKQGFMSKLFGGANKPAEKRRSIVLFITDGSNTDHARCQKVLEDSQNRGDEVYFLFIGIGAGHGDFPFLVRMADKFANTGLVIIKNLKNFVKQTDEQISEEFVGDELITWLKK